MTKFTQKIQNNLMKKVILAQIVKLIKDLRAGKLTKNDLYKMYDLKIAKDKMTIVEFYKLVDEVYSKIMDLKNDEKTLVEDLKNLWGSIH